jgi:hypothetical protein
MAFKRYLVVMGVGAGLMYLFDPRQGRERREALSERVHHGRDQAGTVVDTGRQTLDRARETAGAIREHAQDAVHQAGEKIETAKKKVTSVVERNGNDASHDGPQWS